MDIITPVLWPTTPAESHPIISPHVVHFHLFADPSDILMFTYYLECIYVYICVYVYSIPYYIILQVILMFIFKRFFSNLSMHV